MSKHLPGSPSLITACLAACLLLTAACEVTGESPCGSNPGAAAGKDSGVASDRSAPTPDSALAAAAGPSRITSFKALTSALEQGRAVRAVVHYKVCDLLPGNTPFGVDVTGAMTVRHFDLIPRGTGMPKAYVEFSEDSLVWLWNSGKWRYVKDHVRVRIYDDLKVLVQADYYDPSTFSNRMHEQLVCKVDPGNGSGSFGVSLFKLPGAPRTLATYKELMAALRGGSLVRTLVDLSKCVDAKGGKGPGIRTSVDIETFEQFERNIYGNALAYVSASSNNLVSDSTSVTRRYIKLRMREDNSVEVVVKHLDPVKFTDSSDTTFTCALGSSVRSWIL